MGTYPRHVLNILNHYLVLDFKRFIFFQFHVFPVSQLYFDDFWIFWAFFLDFIRYSFFRTYLHSFLMFWTFFFDLGTNTHQTHRFLLVFRGLRLFHSSFLKTRAREKLFSTRNNISKLRITSKKNGNNV